jgi:hypothetical protein
MAQHATLTQTGPEFTTSAFPRGASVWLAVGLSGLCWAAIVIGVPVIFKLAGFLDFG